MFFPRGSTCDSLAPRKALRFSKKPSPGRVNIFGFYGCNALNFFILKDHQRIRFQLINNKHIFNKIKTQQILP